MNEKTLEKLQLLGSAAKYDVSCSSSGSSRRNAGTGIGNTVYSGVCHSFTEDGRCISLLKVLLSNVCVYDCAYCMNRKSNDIRRATFTTEEIVEITLEFYKRNYIEGLFLSSGVFGSPDYTMERLIRVAVTLREKRFNGYIHLKAIPGADELLIKKAGLYADRLSVNIEIPTEPNLKKLAPGKNYQGVFHPMRVIKENIEAYKTERKKHRKVPSFSPAGQSTQLVIGATPDNDLSILALSSALYHTQHLKRVYYSAYVPVSLNDSRLPALTHPPLVRENRLYQADWLMRFYHFRVEEIVNEQYPELDLAMDPKLSYALRHPWIFPVDINKADYEMILRVPGVGVKSAKMIVAARRFGRIGFDQLKKMGVAMKRAKYFIDCKELPPYIRGLNPEVIKKQLLLPAKQSRQKNHPAQLRLF